MERWSSKKIHTLLNDLESVYGKARFLPRFDPLEELVSCILSQHTADANSFPTFTELRAKHPTWQEIVDLGNEKLAVVIKKAGLANQKAKSIIGSLIEIKKRNGDYSLENLRNMPLKESRNWLLSLPGVGPKTAAIVLCFSFGKPAIPVDTHVFRVSWRIGIIKKDIGENKAHDLIESIVPDELSFRYHTAFIQHGRQTCKAPTPQCERCNVASYCDYFKSVKSRFATPNQPKPKRPSLRPSEQPEEERKGRAVRAQSKSSPRQKK